jgi:hypothetical protein
MNVMIRNIIDLSRGEAVKHGVSVERGRALSCEFISIL